MKNKKNILLFRIIMSLIFAFVVYYFTLPAINIHSTGFWMYVLIVILFYYFTTVMNIFNIKNIIMYGKKNIKNEKKFLPVLIVIGIFPVIAIINIIFSPIFMSESYASRIKIDTSSEFVSDVEEVNFNAIPLLDKDSSTKLGDRVMGQMTELVSQFYVSDLYTQINYNSDIVRVTPLEYVDIIKYFTNHKEGIKGYIIVNSVSGEANLVKLDKGMKYMPSAILSENLYRKLRFSYPTEIFDDVSFEIDNEGNPYWIVPTINYTGVELKKEIDGVIILDPISGKSKKYKVGNVPTWVDHVYSADLIIEQVDDWGEYKNGFFNSLFGQKGVVMTTDGYNYTTMNDDVYLYTGITSVASDESNLGFILCNMRTKETKYYQVAGAEEYSAMASAEGQVQQMSYKASFPLLINLNNKPTYFMSLKDNAGLVKMYAFVDVVDYQKVVVTDSSLGIEKAKDNYLNGVVLSYDSNNLINKNIIIRSISMAIISNNSYYYIVDNDNQKYKVSIETNSNLLPFLKENDIVNVSYVKSEDIIKIKEITNSK